MVSAITRAFARGQVSIQKLLTDRCEILRRPESRSPSGAVTQGDPVVVVTCPCLAQSAGTMPIVSGTGIRFTEQADAVVYVPVGTDVQTTDDVRVVRTGKRYRIQDVGDDDTFGLLWPLAVRG